MANLFSKAKAKAPVKSAKDKKPEVLVKGNDAAVMSIRKMSEIKKKMDELAAELATYQDDVKTLGIESFVQKYEQDGKYTESFMVIATSSDGTEEASYMFLPTDRYIKIDQDRADMLTAKYGEGAVKEETTYTFDNEMLAKEAANGKTYGEIISDLIEGSKHILPSDKDKLFTGKTAIAVAKGTIKNLRSDDMWRKFPVAEIVADIVPVYQIKGTKYEKVG